MYLFLRWLEILFRIIRRLYKMLTTEEQKTVKQVEAIVDNLAFFQCFRLEKLKSGTWKLTSDFGKGNLVIKIAIIEMPQ